MWKTLFWVKCPLICAIKILCHDQKAKELNIKVYKHKWKEKHQVKLVKTVRTEEHTEVLQQIPPIINKLPTKGLKDEKQKDLAKWRPQLLMPQH